MSKDNIRSTLDEMAETLDNGDDYSPSVCFICRGSGYAHPLLPDGKVDYSRAVPCLCQS